MYNYICITIYERLDELLVFLNIFQKQISKHPSITIYERLAWLLLTRTLAHDQSF